MNREQFDEVSSPRLTRLIGGPRTQAAANEIEQMQLCGPGFDHCREYRRRRPDGTMERIIVSEPYSISPGEFWSFAAFCWRYGLAVSIDSHSDHAPGRTIHIEITRDESPEAAVRRRRSLTGKHLEMGELDKNVHR